MPPPYVIPDARDRSSASSPPSLRAWDMGRASGSSTGDRTGSSRWRCWRTCVAPPATRTGRSLRHSLGQPVEILGAQLEVVASVPAVESSELRFELPRGCTWRASGRPGTGCSSWVAPETSSVSLSSRGPKVRCRIEASEATAQIVVTLGQSEPVAKGHGVLLVELPPGLYKATMRVGFAVPLGPSQSLSLLDRPLVRAVRRGPR